MATWPEAGGTLFEKATCPNCAGTGAVPESPGPCTICNGLGWYLRAGRGPAPCEHGVPEGDWCGPCNAAYKRARIDNGLDDDAALN